MSKLKEIADGKGNIFLVNAKNEIISRRDKSGNIFDADGNQVTHIDAKTKRKDTENETK